MRTRVSATLAGTGHCPVGKVTPLSQKMRTQVFRARIHAIIFKRFGKYYTSYTCLHLENKTDKWGKRLTILMGERVHNVLGTIFILATFF